MLDKSLDLSPDDLDGQERAAGGGLPEAKPETPKSDAFDTLADAKAAADDRQLRNEAARKAADYSLANVAELDDE